MTTRVASLHVASLKPSVMPAHLMSLFLNRHRLSNIDGCVLGKIVGTSRKGTTKASVEPLRWAIFAVWQDKESLETFEAQSKLLHRWERNSSEFDRYELEPISSRGTWDGIDPFPALTPRDASGPIAVLTRASVRYRHWKTFTGAIPTVDEALQQNPGCSLAMGMGEWPIGQQATFSTWDSRESMSAFAHSSEAHSQVIKQTYKENWYSEELFAQFKIVS